MRSSKNTCIAIRQNSLILIWVFYRWRNPSNQCQIIEQVTFTYSPSGKAPENQGKTIEDAAKKWKKVIEDRVEKKS